MKNKTETVTNKAAVMNGGAQTSVQNPGIDVSALEDAATRAEALDTSRSFLVQAPAGSGKTELLIRRFLKLLAEVDEPEEILAITFTRAATAEMRGRVLDALAKAKEFPQTAQQDELVRIASVALKNDTTRGWRLLEQPQRLNIQTIDSLCLNIAHRTPLLSRLGGSLTPTEHAEPLYALAARRTLARLGSGRPELSSAIRALLEVRDTSLTDCERLIAGMLERRDQWGQILSLVNGAEWQKVRSILEAPFLRERHRLIAKARAVLGRDGGVAEELLSLAAYACGNLECKEPKDTRLSALKNIDRLEELEDEEHWKALYHFLLTSGKKWRKKVDARLGFPPASAAQKQRYAALICRLEQVHGSLELICELPKLPPASYSPEQWGLLEQILLILHHAAAELRVIFAEQNVVDFVELGLAARQALGGESDGPENGYLPAARTWRHLLVDEFQDTSRAQYELLTKLVEQWDPAERNTCFLVGDPMQSIYGFRQAEVELFERTRRHGLGNSLHLHPLVLQTNFRSHAGLVSRLNGLFQAVFVPPVAGGQYQVSFAPSVASKQAPKEAQSVGVAAQFLPSNPSTEDVTAAEKTEADDAVRVIENAWRQGAGREDFRIAVLVRARKHLAAIAHGLRAAEIPYRAVEIEELGERQEVLDLAALVRSLLHPMDRIAWLSVLRAPWCGLTLKDLHVLCGADDLELAKKPVLHLLRMRLPLLSADGNRRVARVAAVLEDALRGRHRQVSFAAWVERTWQSLGGRECVDRIAYENVRAFFRSLAEVPPDGTGFEQQLERLFAEPDPKTDERSGVQLMTIHKAKGLGFDVVIVPGLQRATGSVDAPLLNWLERTTLTAEETEQHEVLVAPIGRKGEDSDPLYRWITKQQERKEREEAKRLLYVACTRAKQELHLMGTASLRQTNGSESIEPGRSQSLLKTAWPALKPDFEAERRAQLQAALEPIQPMLPFRLSGDNANAPRTGRKTLQLRRLAVDRQISFAESHGELGAVASMPSAENQTGPFERPAGSLRARALGLAVHALLEELTIHLTERSADELTLQIPGWRPRAAALLRHAGLPTHEAEKHSAKVIEALKATLEDKAGRWILAARNQAETETSWTAWDGSDAGGEMLTTLRGDRIFRAGAEPESLDESHLWIVDYKTAEHGTHGLDDFLQAEREKYAGQLNAYAHVMRQVHGETLHLRLALYYPLLKKLLWWVPRD